MGGDERCVCQRQKIANQMLKQVQHDRAFCSRLFVIPNQVLNLFQDLAISRSRFWV